MKHEALAVRRQRTESVPVAEVDLDGSAPQEQRPVDELLAGRERVRRSAEALRRIKPDEAKALILKAQGLSYAEIGETLAWTYTKVNRCLTEGRAHFIKAYGEIEAGEECERFAPTLAALAGGTASADALLELRPHIRNCPACRATVRELHATRLGRLAALWPLPALVAPLRLGVASVKQHAAAAYYRAVDLTPLAGARPGAAAAAIAGCIAVGSGTTYCVTQGMDPIGGLASVVAPAPEREREAPRKTRRPQARVPASPVRTPAATPVVTPTAAPPTSSPEPTPTVQATPHATPEPTPPPRPEEEYEPVAPATAASTAPAPPPARTPAPAPAGGPGEFDGP